MFRGAFIRADGLVIPNNITVFGSGLLLRMAVQHIVQPFWIALVNCVPDPLIQLEDVDEPTIGVNGYARQPIAQDDTAAGWPTVGTLNGESFCMTDYVTFTAAGGPFDKAVNRLALCTTLDDVTGDGIVALSAAMPAAIIIDPDTDLLDRKFKYAIYAR
jgi:hypothetical protein